MSQAKKTAAKSLEPKELDYRLLLADVVALLYAGRQSAVRAVNATLTATYWEVGRRIVEYEQGGREKAEYGAAVIDRLAADLGRGFSRSNLFQIRVFYLEWEIVQTPSGLLQAR